MTELLAFIILIFVCLSIVTGIPVIIIARSVSKKKEFEEKRDRVLKKCMRLKARYQKMTDDQLEKRANQFSSIVKRQFDKKCEDEGGRPPSKEVYRFYETNPFFKSYRVITGIQNDRKREKQVAEEEEARREEQRQRVQREQEEQGRRTFEDIGGAVALGSIEGFSEGRTNSGTSWYAESFARGSNQYGSQQQAGYQHSARSDYSQSQDPQLTQNQQAEQLRRAMELIDRSVNSIQQRAEAIFENGVRQLDHFDERASRITSLADNIFDQGMEASTEDNDEAWGAFDRAFESFDTAIQQLFDEPVNNEISLEINETNASNASNGANDEDQSASSESSQSSESSEVSEES